MIYRKIKLEEGQRVFFTSDTHYGHKNICRGTSTWNLEDHGGHTSVRDFDTLSKMNDAIVEGINNLVGLDDWLVHLGDWSFGGIQNIWEFKRRILTPNIIVVLGNHDHHIANHKLLPNVKWHWEEDGYEVEEPNLIDGKPKCFEDGCYAQQLFDGEVYSYLNLSLSGPSGKRSYILQHYPIAVWDKAHKNSIHLYGHVHGSYENHGKSMDVGIDNAFKLHGEYRPFAETEVQKVMGTKKYTQLSHHNKNTN